MGKILIIIVWLFLGGFYWWVGRTCCDVVVQDEIGVIDDKPEVNTKPVIEKKRGPLVFLKSTDTAYTNDQVEKYLRDQIKSRTENQRLQLIGLYSSEEENSTEFTNLGLARAHQTKILLAEIMDTTGVTIGSKLVDASSTPEGEYFESVDFEMKVDTEKIKEIDDRTLIYFPYNSTRKLDDVEIEEYLDDVAERVKKSGEIVRLTGHTDSFGDAKSNLALGQERARVIKHYLKRRGVSASQIITESKGEADPIAPNSTSEGRSKNRRTELVISSKQNE